MTPPHSMLPQDAPSHAGDLIALRRELHQDPETGINLPRTQGRVHEALRGLDLEIATGQSTTSVVAVLRGTAASEAEGDRPSVLLRGDMDALPITELTGLSFASRNGAMHACGHDMHTAGLVGAAKILSGARDLVHGDVIFMFQPGEEGFDGARLMIEEGVLSAATTRPVAAYGVHMAPDSPAGLFTTRPGAYMAAFCQLDVTIQGRGGHGSRPYQTLDPIQVGAEIVGSLQTFITRRFNVFDPAILTVGSFHGGNAANIIPDTAAFQAGIRCFSSAVEDQLEKELPQLVQGIAQAHQMSAEVKFERRLPPTINDDGEAAFWATTARRLFGESRFEPLPQPKTGSEDFSRVLTEVSGSFGHLGAGPPELDPADWRPIHSARAVFDDRILSDQALFLANLAHQRLQASGQAFPSTSCDLL